MDIFKSTPAKGAIERDWTQATLVLDIQNALGEKFHSEIEPAATLGDLPARYGDTGWNGKCQIDMQLPILSAEVVPAK
jgi:hypothetical protein